MGRHRMAFNGWIADCGYGSRLCAYTDRIRFRTDRNRPDVAHVNVIGAAVVQIRPSKKAESDILISLGTEQCSSAESTIEVNCNGLNERNISHGYIRVAARKITKRPVPTARLRPPEILLESA